MPTPYAALIREYADSGLARNYSADAELPCLTLEAQAACCEQFPDALDALKADDLADLIREATKRGHRGRPEAMQLIGAFILNMIDGYCLHRMTADVQEEMAAQRGEHKYGRPWDDAYSAAVAEAL